MNSIFAIGEQISVVRRQHINTTSKVFCVQSGYIGMYVGAGKKRHMLVILKTGDVFPLNLAFSNQLWQSAIHYIALSTATLRALPRDSYVGNSGDNDVAALQEKLVRALDGYTWLMERVVNLLAFDVASRFYMRMLMLADLLGSKESDTVIFEIPLSYVDIAESIGTTRETVNRLITALQNEGILSVEKRIITIHSISKLTALYSAHSQIK